MRRHSLLYYLLSTDSYHKHSIFIKMKSEVAWAQHVAIINTRDYTQEYAIKCANTLMTLYKGY